jgi:RimJ/RimL family protein N-acetyltransferase
MIESLETERLIMRPFTREDLDDLSRLQAEESFCWFPLRRGMHREETARFLDRVLDNTASHERPAFHAVVERSTGMLIGWAGLAVPDFLPEVLPAVEVGWRLGSDHRGRGYATEAASAALDWGFDGLRLDSIISIFEPDNVASGRVMDRLGLGPGYETSHPALHLPLVVRTIAAGDWKARDRSSL